MEAIQQDASVHEKILAKLGGDPLEDETQAEPEVTESVDDVTLETAADEIEDDSGETPEVESEVEGEPQAIGLDAIADYLGVDIDKLDIGDDGLLIKTKVDGEEGRAKFADMLKSYQLEGHLNKQNMEVAEQKKALQAREAEINQRLDDGLRQAEELSKIAYNELLSDYNSINWQELRSDDPAEYSAKMTDFQTRQSTIAQAYQNAVDQRSEITTTDTKALEAKAQEESRKLLQAFPKWSDPEVLNSEITKIGGYAKNLGFSDEDIRSINDHRVYILLDKAAKYDALEKKSPAIENKVRKAPKIVRPGSTATHTPNSERKLADLKQQIRKTGGGKSVRDYLLEKGIA